MPPLRGRPGRPARKPGLIQGDRGYDSQPHRDQLLARGIASQLAKRRTPQAPFDYTDGAAEGEITLRRARQAFLDI